MCLACRGVREWVCTNCSLHPLNEWSPEPAEFEWARSLIPEHVLRCRLTNLQIAILNCDQVSPSYDATVLALALVEAVIK